MKYVLAIMQWRLLIVRNRRNKSGANGPKVSDEELNEMIDSICNNLCHKYYHYANNFHHKLTKCGITYGNFFPIKNKLNRYSLMNAKCSYLIN